MNVFDTVLFVWHEIYDKLHLTVVVMELKRVLVIKEIKSWWILLCSDCD